MSREAHVPFYEGLGVQFPRPTQRRLLGPIGHVPPAECEQQYYLTQEAPVMEAAVN